MKEEPDHFITRLSTYSFGNCKRAYYFQLAGLKIKEIARMISEDRPFYKLDQIREMIKAFGEALAFEAEVEARRVELTNTKEFYYNRKLDSWESEIITRACRGKSCWYAGLDTRGDRYSSIDFATGADTRQDAVRMCALKIRLDQLGIGKYAPHKIKFEMQWEWGKEWAKKETQRNYRKRTQVNLPEK